MSRNNTECMRCCRPIRYTIWHAFSGRLALCPTEDVSACLAIVSASHGPPPEPDPDPDLLPPEDIDICTHCNGVGEVFVRRDWETGAIETTPCVPCGGSGEVTPEWYGPEMVV
jgi:hypothetical protein